MYLISHFYNEEFLLPFWLKHHIPLFDHGVMIDYGSTDHSVEIIREMAPDWEIRPTRNKFFGEPDIGNEVMAIEPEFKGWKMVLNTTEFILHPDLRSYTKGLGNQPGICTTGVIMVDDPAVKGEFNTEELLVAQKTFGYFEVDIMTKGKSTTNIKQLSRRRLLHQQPCGKYGAGRHTNRVAKDQDPHLFLCWFGWSPFNQRVKNRKLQIKEKAPEKQKKKPVWAGCYMVDEPRLEEMYQIESKRSYDLLKNKPYAAALKQFIAGHPG